MFLNYQFRTALRPPNLLLRLDQKYLKTGPDIWTEICDSFENLILEYLNYF